MKPRIVYCLGCGASGNLERLPPGSAGYICNRVGCRQHGQMLTGTSHPVTLDFCIWLHRSFDSLFERTQVASN